MSIGLFFGISTQVVGGLGVFLLGMKFMSEGMQAVAGSRLRRMISSVTDNRIVACFIGTLITGIVQSSSVTTVMVVGFVNSGFMTLLQAIGVILGANIGTTVTAWIIALKIGKFGLPIVGVAAFFFLFAKKERVRYTAMTLLGVGMVFFGLTIMGAAFKTPEVKDYLTQAFTVLDGATYIGVLKCAFFGCLATAIVQSSSATIGITIALARSGIIDLDTAAALVLGLNIGTTVTAFLASIGTSTNAKRAAYSHIIFNVIGTLWLIPFFFAYTSMIESLFAHLQGFFAETQEDWDDITAKIALVHTGFNVINTIVFLPMMGLLAKLVKKLAPDKTRNEVNHLAYFDVRMLHTPALAIVQSKEQTLAMAGSVEKMTDWLGEVLASEERREEVERRILRREVILNNMRKEVVVFLSEMLTGQVPHDVIDEARSEIRLADEYENLSNYLASVLKDHTKLRDDQIGVSPEGQKELVSLHSEIAKYIKLINDAVRDSDQSVLVRVQEDGERITARIEEFRNLHLIRLSEKRVPAMKSLVYTDMLHNFRRIKDHGLNIAELLAGRTE